MKGKNSKYDSGCPNGAVNSKCISWQGPAIPCLDICHNDVLTDVVYAIADKVCDIVGEMDLSTLDLHCLIELVALTPEEKTLKTILQLLFDNQCTLKNLIDDIIDAINNAGSGGAVVLTLDMKCLTVLDSFGNPIPQDINQTLQSIVNELCLHKSKITTLETKVIDLQNQIDNIDTSGGTGYTPPKVTFPAGYVFPSDTEMDSDDAVQYVINANKDLQDILGTDSDLAVSVGRQCPNLNTVYGLTPNWDLSPSTIADTVNNLWIALCDALNRIKVIETTCCAPSCKDVQIGFSAEYVPADNTFILTFDTANGTEIPLGFTDCGSLLTLTDHLGNIKKIPITIEQGEEIEISASGLNLAGLVNVSIKTCFEHVSGLKCNDCFGGVVSAESACAYCKLCAVGGEQGDTVEIMYHIGESSNIITKVLGPDECLFFETKDGKVNIDSLWYSSNSIRLETDDEHPCTDVVIPEPTPDTCWFFGVPLTTHIDMFLNKTVSITALPPNGDLFDTFFDLHANSEIVVPMYSKLYDIHNLNGTTIGGRVGHGGTDGNDTIYADAPTGLPTSVLGVPSLCPGSLAVGFDGIIDDGVLHHQDGYYQGNNVNAELLYKIYNNDAGRFGFVLKLKAQPKTNIPIITYTDPISGNEVMIQGVLEQSDCECTQ